MVVWGILVCFVGTLFLNIYQLPAHDFHLRVRDDEDVAFGVARA